MANFVDTKQLTLAGAKVMGEAAIAEATKNGWGVAVVVVDAGGNPLYLARMENAPVASHQGASSKARTAATFGRSTKLLDDGVASGRSQLLAFPDILPIQGGLPINVGSATVGGIGVGGATSEQDEQCAQAGIDALGI
ncbi:MAG: heme-binding protein [Proteobacteria bacterium]|nr:heme-binding protein [Pseudomonadota bacterium]